MVNIPPPKKPTTDPPKETSTAAKRTSPISKRTSAAPSPAVPIDPVSGHTDPPSRPSTAAQPRPVTGNVANESANATSRTIVGTRPSNATLKATSVSEPIATASKSTIGKSRSTTGASKCFSKFMERREEGERMRRVEERDEKKKWVDYREEAIRVEKVSDGDHEIVEVVQELMGKKKAEEDVTEEAKKAEFLNLKQAMDGLGLNDTSDYEVDAAEKGKEEVKVDDEANLGSLASVVQERDAVLSDVPANEAVELARDAEVVLPIPEATTLLGDLNS
ncbi:hypothetical protein E6O75_ATG10925 [Venturia nashicola]|uniref:Uncharacterized protein n=1 Tax=Venturia nashicola TaxID=86259 RepID=A0A4Z1PBD7_9PEZI|nr:hypothetical protein E6O75_ATG10925 [Venturia nashicola]